MNNQQTPEHPKPSKLIHTEPPDVYEALVKHLFLSTPAGQQAFAKQQEAIRKAVADSMAMETLDKMIKTKNNNS